MRFSVVVVTRNQLIYASTLHLLVGASSACLQRGWDLGVHFVRQFAEVPRIIGDSDRLLWADHGTFCDESTLAMAFDEPAGWDVLVFPAPTEGVDWARFRERTLAGSTEPVGQRGLRFDTEVAETGGRPEQGLRVVARTDPAMWVMDCSRSRNKIATDDVTCFQDMIRQGLDVWAWTHARVGRYYPHECVGSILESASIKVEPGP